MTTVSKNSTLETLGLPVGDHLVRFHVEGDEISFELENEAMAQPGTAPLRSGRIPPLVKGAVPDLEGYRQQVAVARAQLATSPWKTTREAIQDLREGETE